MNIRRLSLLLFFALISLLTFFMLIPSPPDIPVDFRFIDKIEHFAAFFALSLLLLIGIGARQSGKRRGFILSVLILSAYGAFIEILQGFTGRSTDFFDLISDIAGIVAGGFVYLFFL